jgi:hypothetical protein
VEIRADCSVVKRFEDGVSGHEISFDHINGGSRVISISLHGCDGNIETEGYWRCEDIVSWDLATNTLTSIIKMGDYYDPSTHWGQLSEVTDWLHVNAASAGNANNIVVGIRHFSAVVSFDHDTYEIQWTLSSEIESDFDFLSEEDKFYNSHGVHQLENGNIMMYDNGNMRPAVSKKDTFSRGVEYALDFSTMTAAVVWEFRTPPSTTQGSAVRLDNGNTLVTCPSCATGLDVDDHVDDDVDDDVDGGAEEVKLEELEYRGVVYEVDTGGRIVARVLITPFEGISIYRGEQLAVLPYAQ